MEIPLIKTITLFNLTNIKNMKDTHKEIIKLISDYLEEYPEIRFTQALYNLRINGFYSVDNPEKSNFLYRDNYNDSDEDVLKKIKKELDIKE